MRFSTPLRFQPFFYFGIHTKAYPGDEAFGLAFGRLYLGYYGRKVDRFNPHGWCAGILDEYGCLN